MSRDSSMQPSVSWEGVAVRGPLFGEWALMFWRDRFVNSMKNELEGDQSECVASVVLGCAGCFRTQCQQLGAVTVNLDPVQLSCQAFCSQSGPLIR